MTRPGELHFPHQAALPGRPTAVLCVRESGSSMPLARSGTSMVISKTSVQEAALRFLLLL